MIVDVVLGSILLLSVLLGVLRGALLEVLSLGFFGAAILFARQVGGMLLPAAAYLLPNASALAVHAAATVGGGLLILLVGAAVAELIVRLARRSGKPFTTPDRVAGGSLGGLRALLIWLVVGCFAPAPGTAQAVSPPPTPDSPLARQMRQSRLIALANHANPLLRLPLVRDARTMQLLLADRARQPAFFALPETQSFLSLPAVRRAVADGGLEAAVAQSDLVVLLRSPPFQASLLEPSVLPALRRALAAFRRPA